MDNDRGYKIVTEERDLHTSQCYLGPAKEYSLITPKPSHHTITEKMEGAEELGSSVGCRASCVSTS